MYIIVDALLYIYIIGDALIYIYIIGDALFYIYIKVDALFYIYNISDALFFMYIIVDALFYIYIIGDALIYNNNTIYHTKDHDTTVFPCSVDKCACWWYDQCTWANLNDKGYPGILGNWDAYYCYQWKGTEGMSTISMKIRRKYMTKKKNKGKITISMKIREEK